MQQAADGWETPGPPARETSGLGKLESLKIPRQTRQRVEDAVESLGGRVTVGDVSSRAGLTLGETERTLNALAADSEGTLQVSDAGDVLYVLPQNFKAIIRGRSWLLRLEPALKGATNAAEYVLRVSFGTALVASVALVTLTIVALLTAASSSDRDDRRGGGYGGRGYGGGYYNSPFRTFINISDLFFYWDPYYSRRQKMMRRESTGPNFFEAIFSFVFGDGNPNIDYEEKRWKLVGEYIMSKGGAVTAEQLAPYLDVQMADLERVDGQVNEDFVVPALIQFEGHPEVSETGDLVYVFPGLQRTARQRWFSPASLLGRSVPAPKEQYALESEWTFTKASEGQKLGTVALGLVNLVGVLYLSNLMAQPYVAQSLAQSSLGFMTGLLPFLQVYALSFFAIPLVRWLLNKRRNAAIEERNQARMNAAAALERPALRRKLAAATKLANRTVIDDRDLVYSSDRGMEEQRRDVQGELFDRQLQDRYPPSEPQTRQPRQPWQVEQSRQYEADKELY
ncbi:g10362 [Coccomyxa viridis]|uniref:G10362 protein n=1 Tax=Coccomyxa viridis TaxID=1274662 RepID=A0ABP1G577_9CHLO